MPNKDVYTVGIKIENKEHYDNLMEKHSERNPFLGIDFKGLFRGYPEEYPCLAQYLVDYTPFGIASLQMQGIIEDGYKIYVEKGDN